MPLSFRSRRVVALLACWAVLWAAFLPALVQASSPARSGGIDAVLQASLCSAHAPVPSPSVTEGDDAPAPADENGLATAAHCPLCSSAGENAAPLAAAPPALPATAADTVSPVPLARAAPADRPWPGVSPRGPPASR